MELSFKQSNLSNCQIVETSNGQKYIMDTSTMVGKGYYWGMLPSEIKVSERLSPDLKNISLHFLLQ